MTHRLRDGVLEVNLKIHNLSDEPMPVSIGFHPWFQLTDSPRDQWTIGVGARTQWLLAPDKLPTGETEPIELFFPDPKAVPLGDYNLDHVFGDLIRKESGNAAMIVSGKTQKIEVLFGPKYRASVIYSPKSSNFICFEPMAGISDAMNLAQKGLYKELQSIAPGGTWDESFWVHPSGF
jgi:aldose 1-epimerase